MQGFDFLGKMLFIFGIVLIVLGLFLMFAGRIPYIGRLPGDIVIQRKNFTFYFPITTGIIISIILSLLFWFLGRK
ncbi:MAG: DUF2905 domain-containing protein [Nitrospirae bacterium]|nr:DUF2905 domain-containing protein [Nitrospirota bacterium]